MAKGTYYLNENQYHLRKRDNSFQSCVCILLIFVAICVLITLLGTNLRNDGSDKIEKDVEILKKSDRITQQKGEILQTERNTTENNLEVITETKTTTANYSKKDFENRTYEKEIQLEKMTTEKNLNLNTKTPLKFSTSKIKNARSTDSFLNVLESTTKINEFYFKVLKGESTTTWNPYEWNKLFDSSTVNTIEENSIKTIYFVEDYSRKSGLSTDSTEPNESSESTKSESMKITELAGRYLQNNFVETTTSKTFEHNSEDNKEKLQLFEEKHDINISTAKYSDDVNINNRTEFDNLSHQTEDYESNEDDYEINETSLDNFSHFSIQENFTKKPDITTISDNVIFFLRNHSTQAHLPQIKPTTIPLKKKGVLEKISSKILSKIDHSADACEDFYKYSCGSLQKDDSNLIDVWRRIREQMKSMGHISSFKSLFIDFYKSCVAYEDSFDYKQRINSIKNLFNDDVPIGRIITQAQEEEIDLTDLFSQLTMSKSNPLFDVSVGIDSSDSTYIFQLEPSKLILKHKYQTSALLENHKICLRKLYSSKYSFLDFNSLYEKYIKCSRDYSKYLNFMEMVVKELELFKTFEPSKREENISSMKMCAKRVLSNMDYIKPTDLKLSLVYEQYSRKSIGNLQKTLPLINWKKFFSKISDNPVNDDISIRIYSQDYFQNLFLNLNKEPKWILINVLYSMFVTDLFYNIVIPKEVNNREKFCVEQTSELFPDIAADLYANSFTYKEVEEQTNLVLDIFEKLRNRFHESFKSAKWLETSFFEISRKIFNMKLIHYKSNSENLESKYKRFKLITNYAYNFPRMQYKCNRFYYGLQGKTYSSEDLYTFFMKPYDNIPKSFNTNVSIIGILMSLFHTAIPIGFANGMSSNFPSYILMAKIGIHLAKEIGRHFDGLGIKQNMKLNTDEQQFYDRFFSDTVDAISFRMSRTWDGQNVTFMIPGKLSANERISDSTALGLVTYLKDALPNNDVLPFISTEISKEKIFFITVAQEFCKRETSVADYVSSLFESESLSPPMRVESMVSNSKDFTDEFDCKEGSKMNDLLNQIQFPDKMIEEMEYIEG